MATLLENLITRRNAIGVELASLTSTVAGGKPNTSGEGTSVDHTGYKDALYRELREINSQIATISVSVDGPYEYAHLGRT